MCACVCVCLLAHVGLCECTTCYYFAAAFLRLKTCTQQTRHCAELHSRIYCYMLMHCKHLPARNSRVKQEALQSAAQEEKCVYICDYRFDLSPHAEPFVIQTKGGTLQILRRFVTHLSQVQREALNSSQSTLLPRRSHVSH